MDKIRQEWLELAGMAGFDIIQYFAAMHRIQWVAACWRRAFGQINQHITARKGDNNTLRGGFEFFDNALDGRNHGIGCIDEFHVDAQIIVDEYIPMPVAGKSMNNSDVAGDGRKREQVFI